MAKETGIEWASHTWSPWRGCENALLPDGSPHPGCAHCYAETLSKRNPAVLGVWGPPGVGTRVVNAKWSTLRTWNNAARKARRPAIVFPSLCDPFEAWSGLMVDPVGRDLFYDPDVQTADGVPWTTDPNVSPPEYPFRRPQLEISAARRFLFEQIRTWSYLNFTLLTKRPDNVRWHWPRLKGDPAFGAFDVNPQPRPIANAWVLYSASDQASYDAGVGELIANWTASPVLGLSLEPLVGPIRLDLNRIWCRACRQFEDEIVMDERSECFRGQSRLGDLIGWVIVGGESGTDARPIHAEWVRLIRAECAEFNIPFFFKQWGEWIPCDQGDCDAHRGRVASLRHDGRLFADGEPQTFCCTNCDSIDVTRVGKAVAGNTLDGLKHLDFPPASHRWDAGRQGWVTWPIEGA